MKKRIDVLLVEQNHFQSRAKAQSAIKLGAVFVDGKSTTKPGDLFDEMSDIVVKDGSCPYVSRAGEKLAGALEDFGIDLSEKTILDMGSSTGGFTDCVLKHGAKKVFAVDVGTDQLDKRIKTDVRVVSMEKTDVRNLDENLFNEVDTIVSDLSFVSVVKILSSICGKIREGTELVVLIKPQFECGKELAKKHRGIIKDQKLAESIALQTLKKIKALGFSSLGFESSKIKGTDGNQEYVSFLKKCF